MITTLDAPHGGWHAGPREEVADNIEGAVAKVNELAG
jgi:hypothetical protein